MLRKHFIAKCSIVVYDTEIIMGKFNIILWEQVDNLLVKKINRLFNNDKN